MNKDIIKKYKKELTQDRLKELLHYNFKTGLFYWVVSRGNIAVGSLAGCLNNNLYTHIAIDGVKHLAHRLVFLYVEGKLPQNMVDHINGVKDDNRWINLRHATRSENQMNLGIRVDNTSGYKGVNWYKRDKKWLVQINVSGNSVYIGLFGCKHTAARAYNKAANNYYGDFAYLNKIEA